MPKNKKPKKEKVLTNLNKNKNKNQINIHINSHNKRKGPRQSQQRTPSTVFLSTPNMPYLPQDSSIHHLYPILQNLSDQILKHNNKSDGTPPIHPIPPLPVSSSYTTTPNNIGSIASTITSYPSNRSSVSSGIVNLPTPKKERDVISIPISKKSSNISPISNHNSDLGSYQSAHFSTSIKSNGYNNTTASFPSSFVGKKSSNETASFPSDFIRKSNNTTASFPSDFVHKSHNTTASFPSDLMFIHPDDITSGSNMSSISNHSRRSRHHHK